MRYSEIYSRCKKEYHENNEFIKVCMNQRCTDRRLCYICCEEQIHKNHQEFHDSQIIKITQLIKECEQKNIIKKQLHDIQENQINQVKQQVQNIYRQLTNTIDKLTNLNRDLETEIQENNVIIENLKKRKYKNEEINKIVSEQLKQELKQFEEYLRKFSLINQFTVSQMEEVQEQNYAKNGSFQQDNLIDLQNQVSFNDQVDSNLHDNQPPHQSKVIYNEEKQSNKEEKLEGKQSQTIEKDQPINLNAKVCYESDATINQVQISPCGRYVACSTDYKLIVAINYSQFLRELNSSKLIQSLKFSSDSFILYFSDDSGFIQGIELSSMQVQYSLRIHMHSIEQIFLIYDLSFLSFCQKEQQIKITQLNSLGNSISSDDAYQVPYTDSQDNQNDDEDNKYFKNYNQENFQYNIEDDDQEDDDQEDDCDLDLYDVQSFDQNDYQQDGQDDDQDKQEDTDEQDEQEEQDEFDEQDEQDQLDEQEDQDDQQSSENDDYSQNQYRRYQTIEKQIKQKKIFVDHLGYLQIDYNQENDLIAYPHSNCLYICKQDLNLEQHAYIKKQIQDYNINSSFLVKFFSDCKQLMTAQSNILLIYQYDLDQQHLSIVRKFQMNSEILSIFVFNKSIFCDIGERIVLIKDDQQNSYIGLLQDYPKQLRHYSPQQNDKYVIVIRGSFVVMINILR